MVLEDTSKWMDNFFQEHGGVTNYNNEINFIIYIQIKYYYFFYYFLWLQIQFNNASFSLFFYKSSTFY